MPTTEGTNMTDEEKTKALHFHHFNTIMAKNAIVKAAQVELKRVRKLAKADGCVLSDIDWMARCSELEDPSIVPAQLLRQIQIASWFALPVNYQPGLFEDREPLVDRAFREGERDALASKNADANPYGLDSAAGQSFVEGWTRGRDQMAAAMAKEMESNIIKRQEQAIPETTDDPETKPETTDAEWTAAAPETVPETPAPVPPKPRAKKAAAAMH